MGLWGSSGSDPWSNWTLSSVERPRARAARVWGGLIGDIVAKSCHLTAPPSHQATELLDAILEGYPKSKKQFFVSTGAVAALPGRASALRAALCSPRRRRSGSRRTRSTTSRCPRLCEAPGGSLPHGDAADAETQLLGCFFPLFFRAWAGPVYLYGFGLKCFAVGVSKTQH